MTEESEVGNDFEERYAGASALATESVINIVAAAQLIEAAIAGQLRERNVSMGGVNVLEILSGAGEPLAPSQIAGRILVTRATVTTLVDSLERRGLVARRRHHADRRMVLVELTPAGRAVLDSFMPVLHRLECEWMSAVTPGDQQHLVATLRRLRDQLRQRG